MSDHKQASRLNLRRQGLGRWARPPGRVVAVDWDGSTLRLARAVRRGGGKPPRITALCSEPVPSAEELDVADAAALGQWLGEVLRKRKLRDAVVMSVPRGQVLLRPVTLPAGVPVEELPAMARFQAGKDLPLASDEAVIDLALQSHFDVEAPAEREAEGTKAGDAAGESAEESVDVLAAAVRRETVTFYQQVAEAAGVKLVALGLRSYGHVRCLEACEQLEPGKRVALVHVRAGELLIDVLNGSDLVFTRAVKLPTVPEAKRSGQLVAEAVRNLRSVEATQPDSKAERLLVTGDTGLEASLAETLGQKLGRPCETLDVADVLKLGEGQRAEAAGAIAALGLAMGVVDAEGLPFDFLHPREAPPRRNLKRVYGGLGTAAAIGLIVMVYGIRHNMLAPREAELAELGDQIAQIERQTRNFQQALRNDQTLQQWQQRSKPWIDHLAYLSAILPGSEEAYITGFAASPSGAMRLDMHAKETRVLLGLDDQLRQAGYQVRPMAVNPGRNQHGYPFQARVELLPRPDQPAIDLTAHQPPARPEDDASLDPPSENNRRR